MAARSDLKVLFVEESESEVEQVVSELQSAGFSVVWGRVENANALREEVQHRRWEVVIADASNERLNVLDTVTTVKAIAPELPVIVIASTLEAEPAIATMRAGATDYISKANLQELGSVIRQVRTRRVLPSKLPQLLLAAQETERRRIARVLHDELGQLLTALLLTLEVARREETVRVAKIAEAVRVAEQALRQARDVSVELWPTILDDLGLAAALQWLADRFAQTSAIAVRIELAPVPRLPVVIETACFRLVQEALTNVARHAEAQTVELVLRMQPRRIEVEGRDDGKGFDVESAWRTNAGKSLGLFAMREYAALAGGELELESIPGRGTTVRAWFPADEPAP